MALVRPKILINFWNLQRNSMLFISHRGNLTGAKPERENSPEYIDEAIAAGFNVEVDVWRTAEGELFLGHDKATYKTSLDFLEARQNKLWIHCKNLAALAFLTSLKKDFNFFWHQQDDYTLTSRGFVWTYPGKPVQAENVIVVWDNVPKEKLPACYGICSDFVGFYK